MVDRRRRQRNAANDLGVTPLLVASANASAPMVDRLLAAGANPNTASVGGESPLLVASRAGNAAAVKALLAKGAQVNAKEPVRGQTALMWAVANRRDEVTRVLIAAGADIHARSVVTPREVPDRQPLCGLRRRAIRRQDRRGRLHAALVRRPVG